MDADLQEALRHLRNVVEAYDHADEHILATWWHGVYDQVDQARAFLKVVESD